LPKYDHKDLLFGNPIRITKRKTPEDVKEYSDGDEGSEDLKKTKAAGTVKKIKKDEIKEKIIKMKNKAKGFEFSDESSDDSFDEKTYPYLPNKYF